MGTQGGANGAGRPACAGGAGMGPQGSADRGGRPACAGEAGMGPQGSADRGGRPACAGEAGMGPQGSADRGGRAPMPHRRRDQVSRRRPYKVVERRAEAARLQGSLRVHLLPSAAAVQPRGGLSGEQVAARQCAQRGRMGRTGLGQRHFWALEALAGTGMDPCGQCGSPPVPQAVLRG